MVDVPGVLCTRDTFGETLGHLAREEQLLQGDLSDDDDDDDEDDDETATTTDTATAESGAAAESGATLAMVCDAFVVCYDPGAPETLDAAADLLPLLAAPRDPLPVRGVLCATHSDCAAASAGLRAAHRRARAEGARLAAHSGLAHCTAAARATPRAPPRASARPSPRRSAPSPPATTSPPSSAAATSPASSAPAPSTERRGGGRVSLGDEWT